MALRTGLFLAAMGGGGAIYAIYYPRPLRAEAIPAPSDLKFEPKKKKAKSAEEYRDMISSQHLQAKKSWENPGVYAWGSNTGLVVAPESNEPAIKTPRRLPFFDGVILRDLKLDRNFAAAVTENGDVLQWGVDYSTDFPGPMPTLTGKNITKISLSKDHIIALAKNGSVYCLPVSREAQLTGLKPQEESAVPFWGSKSPISYTTIKPPNLGFSERVTDISAGQEHCILLTSAGRLFSAAISSSFPSKGQLGIPDLMTPTVPATAILTSTNNYPAHEIDSLKGILVRKIATGDYHSVCSDDRGRVFAWGDNSAGQLGFDPVREKPHIDAPSLLPIDKLYIGTSLSPFVTNVAAGGNDTFFTVDARELVSGSATLTAPSRTTADTWSCGTGIYGTLGNGRWTHIQGVPSKIKSLSGLFEYDETTNTTIPIRISRLSVGATHASAQLSNLTHVDASSSSALSSALDPNETNFGADVLFWGGNEFYQLGTGRRNNVASPTYIAPLDSALERDVGKSAEWRFQVTPWKRINVGGRMVDVEQRVVCGRGVTAVFSAAPVQ